MKQLLIIFMYVFLSESSFAQKYIHHLSVGRDWIKADTIAKSDTKYKVIVPKDTIFIVDGRKLSKGLNLSKYDSLYDVHFVWPQRDTMLVFVETYANRTKSIEDLSQDALVFVNDVLLDRYLLKLIGSENYKLENLIRNKHFSAQNSGAQDHKILGEIDVSQPIPFLPKDFFVVKKYTLESIRYRCYAAVPLLDFFSSADDGFSITNKSKGVIFLVDGRPQSYDFDWKGFKPEDLRKVWVYDPTMATKFFGTKAQKGVVELITKNAQLRDGHFLRGIRVVGEQRNKNGTWQVIADTTMASLEAYQAFKKTKLLEQGPIYMINEKAETEFLNRKTIDIGHISDFYIRKEKRVYKETPKLPFSNSSELVVRAYSDTVFIKTSNDFRAVDRHTNPQIIMEELVKMRMPQIEETLPMYIIDDQEVSLEILQKYRQKDFETVYVLDKTEAIKTYGKKGENGAMIYKLKKKI